MTVLAKYAASLRRLGGFALFGAVLGCATAPLTTHAAAVGPMAATAPDHHPAPPLYVASEAPADTIALIDQPPAQVTGDQTHLPDDDHPMPFVLSENAMRRAVSPRRIAIGPILATGPAAYGRALDCMTMAIAYEAGNQPMAGLESVGQVILNRTRATRYPKSVCGVVFQGADRSTGCQFTFVCDGSLRRHLSDDTIARARAAAQAVLAGGTADHVAGATNYHADYVLPYWASTGTRVTKIGAHIFYRMPGDESAASGTFALADEPEMAAVRWAGARAVPASATSAPRAAFAPWGLPMAGPQQK